MGVVKKLYEGMHGPGTPDNSICPFTREPCMKEKCMLWAIEDCGIMSYMCAKLH